MEISKAKWFIKVTRREEILMLLLTLVSQLLILTSSASVVHPFSDRIDPAFRKEVKVYEKTVGHKISPIITISFTDRFGRLAEDRTIGDCLMGHGRIRISEEFWERASLTSRQTLIFHELGHCDLNEEHRSGRIAQMPKCPTSIMGIDLMSDTCWIKFKTYYIKELLYYYKK